MSGSLSTYGLAESIAKGWGYAVLAYVDHPEGELWVWSGIQTLSYGGHDYIGVGRLGGVSGVGGSKKLGVRQVTFIMSGIPTEAAARMNSQVRNRVARAWLAGLKKNAIAINGDPWPIVDGTCDYQELVPGGNNCAIKLIINEPIWSIEREQNAAFTPQWIKAVHGDAITGLDDIPGMRNRSENWTRE